jgi:hypothetical protein
MLAGRGIAARQPKSIVFVARRTTAEFRPASFAKGEFGLARKPKEKRKVILADRTCD